MHLNIADIDVSVTPLRIREYDPVKSVYFRSVLYKFADHGDGARLVVGIQPQLL